MLSPASARRQAKEGRLRLAPADKLAAWEELKVAAFVRAAGAAWLLPLLDLFVRVQLNILGRHLYLESAVEGRWGPGLLRALMGRAAMRASQHAPACSGARIKAAVDATGVLSRACACTHAEALHPSHSLHHNPTNPTAPDPHPTALSRAQICSGMQRPTGLLKLSAPSQERFLSYAEFLAQQGAAELLGVMRTAAEARLAGVALQDALTAEQVQQLLAGICADFAARAAAAEAAPGGDAGSGGDAGRRWARFLLPSPAEVHTSLAPRAPDNRAVLLGADALLVDAGIVEQLVAEAESVAAGDEFGAALAAGSEAALAAASAQLTACIGAAPVPLAKAVPLVAAVGGDLLAAPSLRPPLAKLQPVRSLSARVYGCCFL